MKRPTVSDEMVLEAARQLAKESFVIRGEEAQEKYAQDIASVYMGHRDGYDMARELEIMHHYEPNPAMVEELDNISTLVRDIHEEACKQWADWCNIQPPYPIGTFIKEGEITDIYQYGAAKYLVKPLGQDDESGGHRRLIVKFEDAEPLKECQAA